LEIFEMKKSLVALAVLAASGAAMAQSSVTLYGILDVWMGQATVEAGGAASVTKTLEQSGGVNGSRWGMKGSEDLGGGLKAIFDLQSGFSLDTGASGQGGLLFGRQAWVGFSSDMGTVKVGRIATPYYDLDGAADAVLNSALSATNTIFRTAGGSDAAIPGVSTYAARFNNAFRYDSPNMSGVTASVEYGLTENKSATVSPGSNTSFGLNYAGGPVTAYFAYQAEKLTSTTVETKYTRLGGSYNLGVATLKALYGKAGNVANVSGADTTEYSLGADFPVSSAFVLSANIAKSDDNSVLSAGNQKRSAMGLGGAYTLSKRTWFYGGYVSSKQTKDATPDTKVSALAVGVQHRF
jgi:predicted porin